MKTIPYLIIALCIALTGCIEVEDNRNRVDSFECHRKATELGVKYRMDWGVCALIIGSDTVYYRFKQ